MGVGGGEQGVGVLAAKHLNKCQMTTHHARYRVCGYYDFPTLNRFYLFLYIKKRLCPTPGCENQWIWAVVSKGVDTTGPNLHIGYNTLICISVARRACVFMAFMPYLATLDLLLMPKVNCMYRLYDSFNNLLLYWFHNAVCSKYSLDKIVKREIIKRLFCHVTHGGMTSQLDITWQRGTTIANHFFTAVWKLANGMAQNHISGVNLSALYA